MAAAIVCRFCGRDVVPLNASRISPPADAATPTTVTPDATAPKAEASPGRDELAEAIARAAKISILDGRAKALAPPVAKDEAPRRTRRTWRLPLSAPLRLTAALAIVTGALGAFLVGGRPSSVDAAVEAPTVAASPPLPAPPAAAPVRIILGPAPAPSPAPPPPTKRASADPSAEVATGEEVDNHLDAREGAEIGAVAEELAAIRDETLKTAVKLEGLFAQARACNLRSERVARAARANAALVDVLSRGQAGTVALARRIGRIGGAAQRSGRGAPCEEVQKTVLSFEGLYRERGLLR